MILRELRWGGWKFMLLRQIWTLNVLSNQFLSFYIQYILNIQYIKALVANAL
jgi:hypothetical protein